MFLLAELRDTVKVHPRFFGEKIQKSIVTTLNKKYANKIVHNVGLCIALWDVTKMKDSYIFPGDGSSHTIVEFRFVVFRPFVDEILTGKIKNSSSEGVNVTLGFFDDIFIPADSLPIPNRFIEASQLWAWEYEMEDGKKHDLIIEHGEEIRFKVIDEMFVDKTPSTLANPTTIQQPTDANVAPYSIVASISDPGLGLLSWWAGT
ncbi:hypothetical protein HELRODRAFT_112966 [Helobdella robusta]|uniref:RNA polymerase III subunit Rpc25 domain-containing protein n=1 Tax=Helobdella robusta TaxID=6412 RepID=T1EFN7_HELRO|nr:hypothetical protein HELRODRAFT_112966 [Helobdella robusta]ESO00825.1 hypothetical protein HELRODRAFT_112966 [Helobdella robusta]